MCQIIRKSLYVCPICGKEYQRKGYYLQKHLKECNAIAWIPKVKVEMTFRQMEEDKFAEAIEKLISGEFTSNVNPIERIKKEAKKDMSKQSLACFKEYKEAVENGGIKLTHVPQEELNHIYNVMVM